MKHLFFALGLLLSTMVFAQEVGTIEGVITDKDTGNQPLPFANVQVKGTTLGTTTDFDGKYSIGNVPAGTHTVVLSFVGYETVEIPNVVVEAGKFTNISTAMSASAAALDEVIIKVQTSREREEALLLEQKKAVSIKESIGAQQLAKQGVTDAATATTKISGVGSSEASGDIFVRGLGDRYLYTTFNGLPIPSDDIEKKNIDLGLFSTRVIQSLSIDKTYSAANSADQSSGTIDISSKELSGTEELSVGVSGGINTNVFQDGVNDNFKVTANHDAYKMGFLDGQGFTVATLPQEYTSYMTYQVFPRLTKQTWNTSTVDSPMNYKYAISAGKKFGEKLKLFGTASQSADFRYREGLFRQFRANFLEDSLTDATDYQKTITTTLLGNVDFRMDDNNSLRFVSLFINKLSDNVFEGGRNGEGTYFEESDPNEGYSQFVRDQNTKETRLYVNQLFGQHDITENNTLNWGGAFNYLNADEPNRIRNEVNFKSGIVQLGRTGGFQQRKSYQYIEDTEVVGFINDAFQFVDEDEKNVSLIVGLNYRNKQRDFRSQFLGVEEDFTNAIHPSSIDDIGGIMTAANFDSELLSLNILPTDLYEAELDSKSAYATFNYGLNRFNINVGLRYQKDQINVDFDVNNFAGRTGSVVKDYDNLYPTANVKYSLNEKNSLRFAFSKTITLPEFKEIAPFEYVSPVGQVTRGNTALEASNNYNFDLKYELFPSSDQLVSLATFYKIIKDPINKVQDRGSSGVFSFFNAGEEATVFGLELESRINLIKAEDEGDINLRLALNATRMWHEQDLKEVRAEDGSFIRTFRYGGKTKEDLQGASDYIFNGNLNFSTKSDNPFDATLVASYASDKIYALGAAETQTQSDIDYNDAIIEEGFLTLDFILRKTFAEHFELSLTGRNLLNPEIERTQMVKPSTTGIETKETVRSYDLGSTFLLGLTYKL